MKRTLSLFENLVKIHPNCYIKINDNYIPSLREIYDFEIVKNVEKYDQKYNSQFQIQTFEWKCENSCTECGYFSVKHLPIIFTLENVSEHAFNLLKLQLLTDEIPKFENVDLQIEYILILEQLTMGNYNEIYKFIKNVSFSPDVYYYLTNFNINLVNYANGKTQIVIESLVKNCGLAEVLKPIEEMSFMERRNLMMPKKECRFGNNCKFFYVPNYKCRFNHTIEKMTMDQKKADSSIATIMLRSLLPDLMTKLKQYDIFLIGDTSYEKNKLGLPLIPIAGRESRYIGYWKMYEHKFRNIYTGKTYDSLEINDLMFIYNPHDFEGLNHDKSEVTDIIISNTYQYIKIYKPYICGYGCSQDRGFHGHGN